MTGADQRFEREVLPHLDAGYNLARWLARDPHDANDVVQEACFRALRYADSVRPGEARSWFLTIVRHAFYDWCKANRRPEVVSEDSVMLDQIEDVDTPTPEEALLRSGQSKLVGAAVEALPVLLRETLVLREFEDLSYKDISRILQVPVGTVMSRLSRARAAVMVSIQAMEAGAPTGRGVA